MEAVCAAQLNELMDGIFEEITLLVMHIDERFPTVFDVPLQEGDLAFLERKEENHVAISEPLARLLFPDATHYVGNKFYLINDMELVIDAVYEPFDEHSLFADCNMIKNLLHIPLLIIQVETLHLQLR